MAIAVVAAVCVVAVRVVLLNVVLRGLLFALSDGDAKEAVSSTCRSVVLHAGKYYCIYQCLSVFVLYVLQLLTLITLSVLWLITQLLILSPLLLLLYCVCTTFTTICTTSVTLSTVNIILINIWIVTEQHCQCLEHKWTLGGIGLINCLGIQFDNSQNLTKSSA